MIQFFLSVALAISMTVEFEKAQLKIRDQKISVELAQTEVEYERGLMFRKTLPEGTGMLFIFKEEGPRVFWMKNTWVPLSIGFFDRNKKLVDIQDMAPVVSEMQTKVPTYTSKKPAQYALEVPKGWFKKNKIKIGDRFELEKRNP